MSVSSLTFPALLLGMLIASLIGAAFHLLRGGGLGWLLLDIVLGWAGFWAGHFLAGSLGWTIIDLGPLHLGPAIAGSLLFLLIGSWLGRIETSQV